MPRIFDNIEQDLLPALRQTLEVAERADFCVGYFNLRGWKQLDRSIEAWSGGEGRCCRLLVGMHRLPEDELRALFRPTPDDDGIDNQTALRTRRKLVEDFRNQLTVGAPTNEDEASLRLLARQIKAKKVVVKLFLRHALHAKLYLLFRPHPVNPAIGFVGSSNLTLAGLSHQGELNVDVLDHDACTKLARWFEDRWCLDISADLVNIFEESWAPEPPPAPCHIYLKMPYHLSREACTNIADVRIPVDIGNELLPCNALANCVAPRPHELTGVAEVSQTGKISQSSHSAVHQRGQLTLRARGSGYVPDRSEWEVVILDFDLSWHKDALEQSVCAEQFASGYLAPEQIQRNCDVSTRSALVDSFGLGMTLFFLRTGQDPLPYQHRHARWKEALCDHAAAHPCRTWKSLPLRFFRLIEQATQDEQHKRWDMTKILGELTNLRQAIEQPLELRSAEHLAEEVATRGFDHPYRWDFDGLAAILELPTGLTASCKASESERAVHLRLDWKATGKQHQSRVTKWIGDVLPQVKSILQRAKWQKVTTDRHSQGLTVHAQFSTDQIARHIDTAATGLNKGLEALRFD
jgi:hypothetical protein